MTEPLKHIWERCDNCGGYRNNEVLFETSVEHYNGEEHYDFHTHTSFYQVIRCCGCHELRYRTFTVDAHDPEDRPKGVKLYPTAKKELSFARTRFKDDSNDWSIPADVEKMYDETIQCINANARTLAGGGLRATVEAICKNLGMSAHSLERKIDELVDKRLLTPSQAALLHEERYIGNAALHELATPTKEEIDDGLQIIETLIRTIYVLSAKAERLKKSREKKERAKKKKDQRP